MTSFSRVVLRTIDVGAARAFYAGILGETALPMVELPPQAIARGAPPTSTRRRTSRSSATSSASR